MSKDMIENAKKQFDAELHTEEYKKILSDQNHLESLLNIFEFNNNSHYLDLGTGNGYLAFALAEKEKDIHVYGLDIAENSIKKNQQIARDKNLQNIKFDSYDGTAFPYSNNYFKGIISRYALHHFPDIKSSLNEINRILEMNGFFILSDPKTYDSDKYGFIDNYQNLRKDGHKHFYYKKEILKLFTNHGFLEENIFYTEVRYPRKYDERYKQLLESAPNEIIDKYKIEVIKDKIFITVRVMNIFFRKVKNC